MIKIYNITLHLSLQQIFCAIIVASTHISFHSFLPFGGKHAKHTHTMLRSSNSRNNFSLQIFSSFKLSKLCTSIRLLYPAEPIYLHLQQSFVYILAHQLNYFHHGLDLLWALLFLTACVIILISHFLD